MTQSGQSHDRSGRSGVSSGLSVILLRPLAGVLGQIGADGAGFLSSLGIDENTSRDHYVPGHDVDHLLEAIAAQRGEPALALTLAQAAVARPLGLFGHMVWLSGTLGDALERARRLYGVISRRTLLMFEQRDQRAVVRQATAPGVTRGRILTEFTFASFVLRAREATRGRFTLQRARFAHRHDGGADRRYQELFTAPVVFGAPADEVSFDASHLALELAGADSATSAALEAAAKQLIATMQRSPVTERVLRVLTSRTAEPISLVDVASQMGVSARTLRRSLSREGASFRAISDVARRQAADDLLASGSSMKEVALRLGFSEPSAFSRAYKRWSSAAR